MGFRTKAFKYIQLLLVVCVIQTTTPLPWTCCRTVACSLVCRHQICITDRLLGGWSQQLRNTIYINLPVKRTLSMFAWQRRWRRCRWLLIRMIVMITMMVNQSPNLANSHDQDAAAKRKEADRQAPRKFFCASLRDSYCSRQAKKWRAVDPAPCLVVKILAKNILRMVIL